MNKVLSMIKLNINNTLSKTKKVNKLIKEISDRDTTSNLTGTCDVRTQITMALKNDDNKCIDAINLINNVFIEIHNISLFDEQKACAVLINEGTLINMDTGEGKTYAIAASAAITAINNRTVTITTENDYLALRDYNNNKKLYEYLGISCSVVLSTSSKEQRIQAYNSDIIYTTIREVAYDYLRNNFASNSSEIINVIRDKLIIDEADSALIDNACQLHIIDHPNHKLSQDTPYKLIFDFVSACSISSVNSSATTVFKYEKSTDSISTTDEGYNKIEQMLINNKIISTSAELYTKENLYLIELFETAVRAAFVLKRGVHYSTANSRLFILDEFSGRKLNNVKLNKGLQQFIEVKEGLDVTAENQAAFSISTKFLIGLFECMSGLSGSMLANQIELEANFQKKVVVIQPHYKKNLTLLPERIFFRKKDKFHEAVNKIIRIHLTGQPILICTNNEGDAIGLSRLIYDKGIAHNTLIDATPKEEAAIIRLAGKYKAITITTSNAARGTDIPLIDWPEEVANKAPKENGIFLLCFGHQPLAKCDMQLLGRIARKGKKGTAEFYSSFEDNTFANYKNLKKRVDFLNDYEYKEIKSPVLKKLFSIGLKNYQKENNNLIINQRAMTSRLMSIVEPYARALYLARISIVEASNSFELSIALSKHFNIDIRDDKHPESILAIFDRLILENNTIVSNLRRSSVYASYGGRTASNTLINEISNQAQEFTNLLEYNIKGNI